MKSKIEVRKFAVEKAVEIMGVGTPDKNIIAKAQEIESYILGEAELPEVDKSQEVLNGEMSDMLGLIKGLLK